LAKSGENRTISEPSSVRKSYTVPAYTECKAPRIQTGDKKEIKAHLSSGNGSLKLEIVPADKVIYLSYDYREKAKAHQYLTDNVRIVNNGGKVSVTKVTAQYWSDNKWMDCDTKIGQLYDGWRGKELQLNASLLPLNIDDKVSLDVAFQSDIVFNGNKISFNDHLHPKLGEPVRIKYTFFFSDDKTNEIVSEFTSPASVFYDKATFMKDNYCSSEAELIMFQELDDVEFQRRYRHALYLNNSKELVLKVAPSNTYVSWTQKNLTFLAGQAAAAGKAEWPLEPIVDKEPGTDLPNVFRAWVLVDLDTMTPYGVKVADRTSTGVLQAAALIPWDKIKAD